MSAGQRVSLLRMMNEELDRRIGGIALPSLILIEGPNDSGKSALTQQIIYGALESGLRVCLFSTEGSGKTIVRNMENLSFTAKRHFIAGRLRVLTLNVKDASWSTEMSREMLPAILEYARARAEKIQLFAVDSLTFLVTGVDEERVLKFFSDIKIATEDEGVSFLLTIHPYALSQELLVRVRSMADAHFLLSIKEMGERIIKLMQVMKVKGASKPTAQTVSFDVDPAFGVRVLPFTQVKA